MPTNKPSKYTHENTFRESLSSTLPLSQSYATVAPRKSSQATLLSIAIIAGLAAVAVAYVPGAITSDTNSTVSPTASAATLTVEPIPTSTIQGSLLVQQNPSTLQEGTLGSDLQSTQRAGDVQPVSGGVAVTRSTSLIQAAVSTEDLQGSTNSVAIPSQVR